MLPLFRILWTLPNTVFGLCIGLVAFLTRGRLRLVDGVVEVAGGLPGWLLHRATPLPGGVLAMTLGHVVLGRDEEALECTRRHERVHVAQYERWGPLFLPAYGLASLLAVARGEHAYRDNVFEREAFRLEREPVVRDVPGPR